MDASSFLSRAPGTLVPITGFDSKVVGGVRTPIPVQCVSFVPNPLPPKELDCVRFKGELSDQIVASAQNIARLRGVLESLSSARLLLAPMRLREAKLSSRIENTIASIEDIAIADVGGAAKSPDAAEVNNYVRALVTGMQSNLPLSVRLFREMHAVLLDGVRGDDKRPGELRTTPVCIGDESRGFGRARFVPPPPGEPLVRALAELEMYMNLPIEARRNADRYPPMVEMAFAHYQFETIHPFRDGNGRLGRLIIPIAACKLGLLSVPALFVSGHFDTERQKYYDLLLRVSTHGDWLSWTGFFLEALAAEAAETIARATRLSALRENYLRLVTSKRSSGLSVRIVDRLFENPALNVSTACRMLEITAPSAQKHLDRLETLGIIREVTGSNYGRIWVASEILECLEAETPTDATLPGQR